VKPSTGRLRGMAADPIGPDRDRREPRPSARYESARSTFLVS
jgi:hypothetical protein